ncbi:MAG: glycosyltransferase family 4 protein [Nanoarchaeota archaeon]|nr:glycosyltransferase family 4 protein [Nanoarchaeota archaeon]MBU1501371.1 glycosyltransferase family 4 protein [Nanoarchaeota archaeon]MBU2459187.1 glycosyltransferase family 4 protein [Nanoarchaeota archaeon]
MRIAFVNDTFLEGRGVDTVIYEVAKRLGKKHQVFVITSESDFSEENFRIIKINGKKLLTGSNIRDSFSYIPNLLRFRKEVMRLQELYRFDIMSVQHSSLNPAFRGLPAIVTWNGSPLSGNKIRTFFNKFVLSGLKRNKISITISEFLKGNLAKFVPAEKIKVIYLGASEEFKPTRKDKGYMFFVGRLEEHKGVHELIKLSKELSFPVYLAGSGPLEGELKSYSKKIGADKVKFLGRVSREDLVKHYQECSFFVSGSKWEGFGLIFVEAAMCAKPSVGYSKGSIPEVISDGESGFVVNDYEELRQKAEMLIKNKKLRKTMGEKALNFGKNFNWDKTVEEYENLFWMVQNG